MTREEEIINAAREYNNGITFSNPSNVLYFEAGAKWADQHPKNVWHDATSEEPLLEEKEIIFLNTHGVAYITERFGGAFSYMLEDSYWEKFVNILRISKWAYVADLLPKGGAE